MNSRNEAAAAIDEVLKLTSDEYLHQQIDSPIEKAYINFSFDGTVPVSHQDFTRITGELVSYLYKYGPGVKRTLSKSQACIDALDIMEEGYGIPGARGYDAAYLSVLEPDGLESILVWMTGFIIARARDRYIKWINTSRIVPLDWGDKCLMAEILLEQWGPFLPPGVLACKPAQLAAFLPELLGNIGSADTIVRENLNSGGSFYASERSTQIWLKKPPDRI